MKLLGLGGVIKPLASKANRLRLLLASSVKLLSPAWRTAISVAPFVVGLFCVVEHVGLAKMIQPFCQFLLPAAAQVGVPPVSAFAVLMDVQIATQLFLVMASVRARATSLAKSDVMLPTWLRTCISRRLGTPIAKMMARIATVTSNSIRVTPDAQRGPGVRAVA